MRLLWESMFVLFDGWALTLRKMVGRNAFLANQKHEYHVSQRDEHDCSAHNENNKDY